MSDSTTSTIDRVFDLVDSVVDKADRALNRTKHTEEQHRIRRANRAEVDTAPSVKVKDAAAASTALATRPRFYIVEAIAEESGATIFVVTDGAHARAECTTRELAQKILRMLMEAPR